MKLFRLKLGHKFLAGTLGIILLLGLSLIVFIRSTLTQKLILEIQEKGIYIAKHLADASSDPLLTEHILNLQMTINEQTSDSDVEYIFIRDNNGKVPVHTFRDGFPAALIDMNIPEASQEFSMRSFVSEGMTMYDIAVPIMKGDLGAVHVGISEAFIRGSVADIISLIIKIVAGVLIVGGLTAIILARRVTKPLAELVETSRQIGSGNFDTKVAVRTDDEIGQLGLTFNAMAGHLKDTTVSRDHLIMAEEKARAERDRAQNYLDVAGVMLVALDSDGIVTLINKKGCEILGYMEGDVAGRNWFDTFVPERMRNEVRTVFKRLMSGEVAEVECFENSVLTHNNKEKLIAWHNTVLKDGSGKITGTLSSGEDITKRRGTEAEVVRNQEELVRNHAELNKLFRAVEIANKEQQKIMDSLGDIIILTDDEGKIKRINNAIRKFTDKPYHEIFDHIWEDLIFENELEATTLYEGSTELLHRPSQKWFELQAYPFEDVELGFSGNVITIHETTEIKKITKELENYSRKTDEDRINLQNALDQISSLMQNVAKQTDTSIRLSSDNLKKCYEVKNCSKKDCACYGKGPMRCWQVAGTYCGGQIQGAFAQKYNNCAGCEVFKEATKDPIYQIGEHFNNMMHVLEVKSRELENAYSELKNTQAQILQREKMASIGQLAAGVAHEINNPTGFILSNLGTLGKYVNKLTEYIQAQSLALESMKADELTAGLKETRKKLKLDYVIEDVGQLIKESIEGGERIKKIVQNLKTFSRVDQAEYKAADINECIESTLNIVWNELKYKTTVEKEYGALPLAKCYPQQLNQIFMNLLVNAAQSIEKQGVIKIKTWNGDGTINILISDTGSGIPEDKLGKIFEPFYTTKPVGQGTGLGLSIVYDIVKKHKGDIRVESKVGSGTVFTIKIPVAEEA
ncbi:MAG: PAS domain S-box protein [Nitrospirae bacterium]|nr:PAS domain S-box protein [Nitrospirota bacterium]